MANIKIDRASCTNPKPAEALAMIENFAPEYVKRADEFGAATITAAYTTHAATVAGVLVDGRKSNPPANSLDNKSYAKKFGVTGSTVTDWQALGRALVIGGIDTTSGEWKALATNHASHKGAVRKYLKGDRINITGLRKVLKEVGFDPKTGAELERKPAGAAAGGPNGARGASTDNGAGSGGSGESGSGEGQAPLTLANVLPNAERILTEATATMATASPTKRAKYREMLAAHLAKVDGIIAADKGTPRSTGGTGIQVPTPATLAARKSA